MNTIGKDVIVEQEISKSSFITYLKLVTTPLDAKNYIKEKSSAFCGAFEISKITDYLFEFP